MSVRQDNRDECSFFVKSPHLAVLIITRMQFVYFVSSGGTRQLCLQMHGLYTYEGRWSINSTNYPYDEHFVKMLVN